MSRGIVSQKPFSRKKRKQSLKKKLNRSGVSIPEIKISQKLKHILSRGMCFVLIIIIGIIILVKSLFFKPEQTISQIKFSEGTLATYQDIELFSLISNMVKGKNYYMILSDKDKILADIQKKFPFVGKIDFQLETPNIQITETGNENIIIGISFPNKIGQTGNEIGNETGTQSGYEFIKTIFPLKNSEKDTGGGTLGVNLDYYEPSVLVKLNDKKFVVWNETTYVEMKEGMLLGIRSPDEEPLFLIETPQYLEGTTNLDGFFFEISLAKMLKIISLAKKEFGNDMKRFVYLAGSTRFAIFTSDDKTLYFNFPEGGNIEQQREIQIFKYNTLKEKYTKFDKIEKLNLGALEENKTIIMNY